MARAPRTAARLIKLAVYNSLDYDEQRLARDAVTDAATMQARMEASFDDNGYHLAIPGRILELSPDELAELLAKARMGQLWQEERGTQ